MVELDVMGWNGIRRTAVHRQSLAVLAIVLACLGGAASASGPAADAAPDKIEDRDCSGPEGTADREPRLGQAGPAVYPMGDARAGNSGDAIVVVDFTASGAVTHAWLWKSTGHESLDKSALASARKARVEPGVRDGCRIGGTAHMTISFRGV